MKKAILIALKICLVIFFGFFLCNELSGPSMSDTDFSVVEENVIKTMGTYELEKQGG